MLKTFRDNLKYLSWVLWIVIAVFILFVFADFGSIRLGDTAPSDTAASIGNLDISFGEFERSYRQTEDFYRQTYGDQFNRELAQQLGLPLQVLDQLIGERIILAEADRMGLRVTDDEVVDHIAEIPTFQYSDGRFVGQERYNQILRSNGYTIDQYEMDVRSDLLSQKVRAVLTENLYVSDDEVMADYKDRTETASIRYLRLPADRLRDEIALTDEEIAGYFADHQEDFRIEERRAVDYLLLDPDLLRSTIELTDGDVNAYYEDNQDQFTQEEQVHARHILLQVGAERTEEQAEQLMQEIRQRLAGGEDFAALAMELSDDPGSKSRGGDLGFFGRGQMIPEFETAAFDAQPAELVGPVRTGFGYHLIEVLEKQAAGRKSLEAATEEIRNLLLTDRSRAAGETRIQELAAQIRKEKIDSVEALRRLAESESGVTVHSAEPFGPDDNVPGIGRATAFTTTAFELAEGDSSDPVPVTKGWAALRLTNIEDPRLPELDEVRGDVRSALLDERQLELAVDRLAEARLSIEGGETLDDVAAELDLTAEEADEFRRLGPISGLGNSSEIAAAAVGLEVGQMGGPIVHTRDVVLFEVTARQRYDPLKFDQERDAAREGLRQQRLTQMLASIISQRRQEMGVHYDTQLLQNFELSAGTS